MKIFAIGMNYTEHNKSLHGTLSKPERPVISPRQILLCSITASLSSSLIIWEE